MTIKMVARVVLVCVLTIFAASTAASPIAETSLEIRGLTLEVTDTQIDLNLGSPGVVQTKFGGLTNDGAPRVEGLVAEGELVGPGLVEPLTLRTAPGHAFSVPGLAPVGDYYLQNIRLTSNGQYLSPAVPSTVHIRVSDTLKTEVKVRQLTPEELRARGIVVDARNFDVYEYTFTFYLDDGTAVEIPFPVIIDPRTREVFPVVAEMPYRLPSEGSVTPPRWTPPTTVAFDLGVEPGELPPPSSPTPGAPAPSRPSIPAALVIPSNLAVLHQFFGVAIVVTNGAPDGSEVVLEEVGATIRTPNQLRVVKSEPSVAFGQAVPIQGPDGLNFLVAQAQGQAEWTVEGLAAGTYTVDVDVRATMKSPGQPDLALKGTKSASMVIHDPRFSVTFSVPSTVFPTLDPQSDANAFSAYAFVTNMSSQRQTISTSSGLSACGPTLSGLCLAGPSPDVDGVTLDPGELLAMEYRLKSKDGGTVFASSTSGGGGALGLSFEVRNGENLNPSTLIMPWYARYLDQAFVNAQLELLGRGYAIATTPTTTSTSKYPRVIKTDVFRRAVDIARAGQRVFLTTDETDLERSREGARFAYSNLSLDLLGARDGRRGSGEPVAGGNAIAEWDELRRTDLAGRNGGSALARQIETTFAAGDDAATIFERFIEANSHRSDFVAAMVHGGNARIRFETAAGYTVGANDAGAHEYTRQVPFADVHALALPDATRAELGLIGRLTTEMTLVLEATGPFDFDLVYPGGADGAPLRITHSFTDIAPHTFRLRIVNGVALVDTQSGDPTPITQGSEVVPPALSILAARQDLYLDSEGHKVSILFNRPVGTVDDMRDVFEGSVRFVNGGFAYAGTRPISAAALQEDGRVVNATFDHGLHVNVSGRAGCSYEIDMKGRVRDPLSGIDLTGLPVPAPRIDNDREAAVILGRVLGGDGQPIPGADVILWAGPPQYDRSADASADASAGAFLFEYVPIEPGNFTLEGITLEGKSTSFAGSVRFDGQVYPLDLQFLGRGGARGFVRYADTNEPVAGATVVVSNRLFGGFRTATTDAAGRYEVSDLPVGTTTFVARDGDGNIVYATNEIAIPGQVLEQDLLIPRRAHPGFGTIRGLVRRSDNPALGVPGAHVGVYSQGYGLIDGYTDAAGRFEFANVPAGSVTVLAEEWTVAWQSAALDFELGADQVKDVSLTLMMRGGGQTFVSVEGTVTKSATGATPVLVPGALVLIDGLQVVTADANGKYTYESVPVSFSGRRIRAHDPATGRQAEDSLPTLVSPGPNSKPLHINTDTGTGTGTIRVLVLDATGQPVNTSACDVVAVGVGSVGDTTQTGVFELKGVAVGRSVQLVAYSTLSDGLLGDQYVTTLATIGFADQVLSVTMRMPGEGSVNVSLVSNGVRQLGDVRMRYRVWDEIDETIEFKERVLGTSEGGLAGYARFTKVPVGPVFDVIADLAAQGNASAERRLEYHGQLLDIDLQLGTRASVSGRVLAFDGITPVAGATVNIIDGLQQSPAQITGIDGSFMFADVAPDTSFQVVADWTANGVNRKGTAYGRTPVYGGKVEDVIVTLMRRANVNVRVVWADQQVDPGTGSLVPDQTPGDYTDNAPIPRASFWMRELEFPRREFGTASNPLKADAEGNFLVPNVMAGPFRLTAVNGDFDGHATGTVVNDGVDVEVIVPVGSDGFGELIVAVLDRENNFAAVPSAEVRLFRNGKPFDVASSDGAGTAIFQQVPATGSYSVQAYSKALGRSGTATLQGSIPPNGTAHLDVHLEVSGVVLGTLTDDATGGSGVVGANIDLNGSGYTTRSTSGNGGAFRFDGIREGAFTLQTRDPLSNRRASAQGEVTPLAQEPVVDLQLPDWSKIRLRVWLPDDAGQQSSNLAPLVRADASQLCYGFPERCEELHSAEGNDLLFDRLLEGDYKVVIQELGGLSRSVPIDGQLGEGQSIVRDVTLPAFGSVRVRVIEKATGGPMKDVKVSVYNTTKSFVAYTDATGIVSAHGFEVTKNASANATTLNGLLSGRATGLVSSASTPLDLTIEMESLASVAGFVEAETGGPSIGTAVTVGGTSTITSGDGRFELGGFKTGTGLTINYFGPDGTIGASQSFTPTQPDVNEAPPVVLDSTRPLILSIVPDNGAIEVPRDASIDVEFSEPISPAFLTADSFRLAKIGSSVATPVRFETSSTETGHYVVSVIPLQDLASHQLYTFVVSGSVADLTGHTLGQNRGISFATTDQSVPQVIAIRPDLNKPVPTNSALQIDFNEALMAEDWPEPGQEPAPGQIGLMKLVRIDGNNVEHAAGGNYSLDPDTQRTLTFAPDELFENSRYRLEVSGVRDTKDNTVPDTLSFAFSTVDTIDPVVTILAPTPGEPLVSGLFYTTQLDIRNDDAASSPATDIERVEYFHRIDGGDWVLTRIVSRSGANPGFGYSFSVPAAAATLGLRVVAWDTSGRDSDPAEASYAVVADAAPASVAITPTAAGEVVTGVYPGTAVSASLTFDESGLSATYQIVAVATKDGATLFTATPKSGELLRAQGAAWPDVTYSFTLPKTLPGGATVTIAASVTDSSGLTGSRSADVAILQDAGLPVVTSVALSQPEANFTDGGQVAVVATATDAEVGVETMRVFLDGLSEDLVFDQATGEFTGSITAPDVSGSEPVPFDLRVEAVDYAGNVSEPVLIPITVTPVFDPTAPVISSVCGTEGVMLPVGIESFTYTVDIQPGTVPISSVRILVNGTESSISSTGSRYSTTLTTVGVAAGAAIEVRVEALTAGTGFATASIEIPIIDAIDLTGRQILPDDLRYENQSIYVRNGGVLTVDGHHSFANVIVLGVLEHSAITDTERSLDLTAAGRIYVGCGGSVDTRKRGYSGTSQYVARSWPNAYNGGSDGAGGSHGGYGAGNSGFIYGSPVWPRQAGASGALRAVKGWNGGAGWGGGVVMFEASRLVVDGSILADGNGENIDTGGGAGGSILVEAHEVIGGADAKLSAIGAKNGGGGRIAIHSALPLQIDPQKVLAHGAGSTSPTPGNDRGSAGTVYFREGAVETLIVDGGPVRSTLMPSLSTLGSAVVEDSQWPAVTFVRPQDWSVPRWIEGSWMTCSADGQVLGEWRIRTRSDSGVVLEGDGPATTLVGAQCRGFWRFDKVIARNSGRYAMGDSRTEIFEGTSDSLIQIGATNVQGLQIKVPVRATGDVVAADVIEIAPGAGLEVPGLVHARELNIRAGAKVTQTQTPTAPSGEATVYPSIDLQIEEKLVLEGTIDATGAGFRGSADWIGRSWPRERVSVAGSGGSFGGRGRDANTTGWSSGSTYGSIVMPLQPGASGAAGAQLRGCEGSHCSAGGGIVHIRAAELELTGSILSNGTGYSGRDEGSAAGGSVFIDVPKVTGAGTVAANGGIYNAPGGGGRIAIRSNTFSSSIVLSAAGGGTNSSGGTVFSQVNGSRTLTVKAPNVTSTQRTEFPSLGAGFAQQGSAGATLVTGRDYIPSYFVGHMVELTGPTGADKGRWTILAINGGVLTLSEGAAVEPDDFWQGAYQFDLIDLQNGAKIWSADPVRSHGYDSPTGTLQLNVGPEPEVRLGSTFTVTVTASDAQGLTKIVRRSTGPVTTSVESRIASGPSRIEEFSVTVDPSAQVGDVVRVFAEVYDEIGTLTLLGPIEVNVIADVVVPSIDAVTFTPASTDATWESGRTLEIGVAASDDSGIAVVRMTVDSDTFTDTTAPYQFNWVTPYVETPTQVTLTFEAEDFGGNVSAPVSRAVTIEPRILAGVSVEPTVVASGASVNGTVTLNYPAPAGGAVVGLTLSDTSVASAPDSVTISEGALSASFVITTNIVPMPYEVEVFGHYGVTLSATFTLESCVAFVAVDPPTSLEADVVWFDEDIPSGATSSGSGGWDSTQAASGTQSIRVTGGIGTVAEFAFVGGSTINPAADDLILVHVLVNSCDPPREILMKWWDGTAWTRAASLGEDRIEVGIAKARLGAIPKAGQWVLMEVPASTVGASGKSLSGMSIQVEGGEAWFDYSGTRSGVLSTIAAPVYLANEVVWFDDALPAGAVSGCSPFDWSTSQVASGAMADRVNSPGGQYDHCFTNASQALTPDMDDLIVTYVLVDPLRPPREIMLQWNDGSGWNRRAYWGENLVAVDGTRDSIARRYMGPVPKAGEWIRLEVPASSMQMAGKTVRGMAFTVYDGQVWFDRVGTVSRTNLASAQLTAQSSTYNGSATYASDKAVNGSVTDFQHTNSEPSAWWQVDLGAVHPIESIDVWNRHDCCQNRTVRFWVLVSDEPFVSTDLATTLSQPGVTGYYHLPQADRPSTFEVSRAGRYVRVQLSGQDYLHLAEVQVWAPVTPRPVNLAGGRNAAQSSTTASSGIARVAALAVNGGTMGDTYSQTSLEARPWWQVDLGKAQQIRSIDIDNASECCVGRMSNFWVFVSDSPFTSSDPATTLMQPGVSTYYRGAGASSYKYDIDRSGRYVRIQLTGSDYLHPFEVRVWSSADLINAITNATLAPSTENPGK